MSALARSIDALPPAEPLRVALLTDRPGALHFIERELKRRGLQVQVAHTGHELLAWLRGGPDWIDAVFVDLGHQEANALSLLRELADELPAVHRVAIADSSLPLLRSLAIRFCRTTLVLEHPLDRSSLDRVLDALEEAVFVGGA